MILAVAKGSRGHYRIGEDGRVYTCYQFHVAAPATGNRPTRFGVQPGERPDPHVHQQFAHSTPFWLPTGQEEPLEGEQAETLEEEREALDARWMAVEAREQEVCPECGKPAVRDHRISVDGRVPFVCVERHIFVDESEPADASGKDAPVRL